jgi:vitamin K-dependent gamma-carboxylase
VRAKGGDVTFVVREPSGRILHVSPRTYLTGLQESEMSSQPDLVLQLAHHIAQDFEQRGRGPVAVFADARVALNGRRSRPMIDPNVDLTQVHDGLAPASWILPAPQAPPPHTRAVR